MESFSIDQWNFSNIITASLERWNLFQSGQYGNGNEIQVLDEYPVQFSFFYEVGRSIMSSQVRFPADNTRFFLPMCSSLGGQSYLVVPIAGGRWQALDVAIKEVTNMVRLECFNLIVILKVSKGVKGLPGSFQSATSNVPSGKSLMYFGLFLAAGVFFIFIAFTMFLPVMVLMPQKFAICFTIGCAFIIGSFFALKGPKNQLTHMTSKERLPFTGVFIGSMVGTVYVSMVLHSYILSVLFSVIQNSSHLELEASVEASKGEDEESFDLPLFCHLNSEIEQDLYMLVDSRETEYLRERRRHYSQKNLSQVFNHVL
ncbi:hypothetical protein CQW23_06302 [Capsicum baccatum]|uniref:Vesicle transport protein n=1 Tax=Capsicum baccatum TaxID=33114 RepID=A0A2G2X309_CAPBA|nr:hypothetical protein CQW23_06302 [Capsicum baccatum]